MAQHREYVVGKLPESLAFERAQYGGLQIERRKIKVLPLAPDLQSADFLLAAGVSDGMDVLCNVGLHRDARLLVEQQIARRCLIAARRNQVNLQALALNLHADFFGPRPQASFPNRTIAQELEQI